MPFAFYTPRIFGESAKAMKAAATSVKLELKITPGLMTRISAAAYAAAGAATKMPAVETASMAACKILRTRPPVLGTRSYDDRSNGHLSRYLEDCQGPARRLPGSSSLFRNQHVADGGSGRVALVDHQGHGQMCRRAAGGGAAIMRRLARD